MTSYEPFRKNTPNKSQQGQEPRIKRDFKQGFLV